MPACGAVRESLRRHRDDGADLPRPAIARVGPRPHAALPVRPNRKRGARLSAVSLLRLNASSAKRGWRASLSYWLAARDHRSPGRRPGCRCTATAGGTRSPSPRAAPRTYCWPTFKMRRLLRCHPRAPDADRRADSSTRSPREQVIVRLAVIARMRMRRRRCRRRLCAAREDDADDGADRDAWRPASPAPLTRRADRRQARRRGRAARLPRGGARSAGANGAMAGGSSACVRPARG